MMSVPKSMRLAYTEDDVQAAVDAVKSKKLSLRNASRQYGVPKTTIQNRINGIQPLRNQSRTVIPPEQERQLVNWLSESARRGFGITKEQLTNAVETVISSCPDLKTPFKDNRPGKKWLSLFQKRHKDTILMGTPSELFTISSSSSLASSSVAPPALTSVAHSIALSMAFSASSSAGHSASSSAANSASSSGANATPFVSKNQEVDLKNLIIPLSPSNSDSAPPSPSGDSPPLPAAEITNKETAPSAPLPVPTSPAYFQIEVSPTASSRTSTSTPFTCNNNSTATNKSLTSVRTLDRLLDIAGKVGTNKLTQLRSFHDLGRQTENPEDQQFCELYRQLSDFFDNSGQKTNSDSSGEQLSVKKLPIAFKWDRRKRKTTESPETLCSDQFREYHVEVEKEKKGRRDKWKKILKEKAKKERAKRKKEKELKAAQNQMEIENV